MGIAVKFYTPGKSVQDETVDDAVTVADVKDKLGQKLSIGKDRLIIVLHGKKLENETELSSLSITKSSFLLALRKQMETKFSAEKPSAAALEALHDSIALVTHDLQLRQLFHKMVSSGEALSGLMASVPGLRDDLTALAVLRDVYLIIHWLSPKNIKRTAEQHPCLIDAAQHLLAVLHQEGRKLNTHSVTHDESGSFMMMPQGLYDEGQESDGESGDDSGDDLANAQQNRFLQPIIPQAITEQQLAEALAAATAAHAALGGGGGGGDRALAQPNLMNLFAPFANLQPQPPPSNPSQAQQGDSAANNSASARPVIDQNFMQLAMQQAMAAAANQAPLLQQLHEMGFYDDDENRQALAATGGNVEAALEWIINRREQME